MTEEKFELTPLKEFGKDIENIPNKKSLFTNIKNSLKSFYVDGASPCPWADYLKCVPQNSQSVDDTLVNIKKYMTITHSEDDTQNGGGFNNYIKYLDSTIDIGKNILKELDNKDSELQNERMRAAAAISYITRLFVLGKEDDVDTLRDYSRRQVPPLELDDVMYKLVTYIKNTRSDKL
jgi:hypothetical protein